MKYLASTVSLYVCKYIRIDELSIVARYHQAIILPEAKEPDISNIELPGCQLSSAVV